MNNDLSVTGMLPPENYATLAAAPLAQVASSTIATCPLYVAGSNGSEILRIRGDGSILWRGREVETDDVFRAAMLDMAETMKRIYMGRVL